MKMTDAEKKFLSEFIQDAEPCITELKLLFGHEGLKLDYSPDSLDFLEQWVIKRMRWGSLKKEKDWYIVRISYYFGELIIRNLGGSWQLDRQADSNNYRAPVIRGFAEPGFQIDTLNFADNLWDKPKKGAFREAYQLFEQDHLRFLKKKGLQ